MSGRNFLSTTNAHRREIAINGDILSVTHHDNHLTAIAKDCTHLTIVDGTSIAARAAAVVGKAESISQIYTTYIFGEKISGHAFAIPGFIAAYMYGGLGGVIVNSICITCILCFFERIINLVGKEDIEAGFMFSVLYIMIYLFCIWDGQIDNWKAIVGPIYVYIIINLIVKVRFASQ